MNETICLAYDGLITHFIEEKTDLAPLTVSSVSFNRRDFLALSLALSLSLSRSLSLSLSLSLTLSLTYVSVVNESAL